VEVRAILDEPCRGYRTTAPSNVPGSHRKSKSHTTFTNTRHHPICIRRLLFDRGAWMTNVSVLQASSNKIGGVAHLQPLASALHTRPESHSAVQSYIAGWQRLRCALSCGLGCSSWSCQERPLPHGGFKVTLSTDIVCMDVGEQATRAVTHDTVR